MEPNWTGTLEEGIATYSSILPGESHGQRSQVGYSPWDLNGWDTSEVTQHIRTGLGNSGVAHAQSWCLGPEGLFCHSAQLRSHPS